VLAPARGARASAERSCRPTAVDLFAGAGGASQGLIDAGFKMLAAVENDGDAAGSYGANHPDVKLLDEDITGVDPADLVNELKIERGDLDLLNACPPCQGFSTLGSGRADDPRNDLIGEVWRFVSAFRPRAIVVENVPGIRRDARLVHLLRQARGAGYTARGYTLEASRFGVPQRRRRHLVIAVRRPSRRLPAELTDLFHGELPQAPFPVQSVFDIAAGIDPDSDPHHIARTLQRKTAARVQAIPPGGGRFDLPPDKQLACHAKLEQRHATGPYGRMKSDQPSPTLTTRCTTVSCGSFTHPTEHRGITLREAALIQTFPLGYAFIGGYDSIERQIGNALPARLAEYAGRAVLALL
jgi:DNA (cytosine-5)-methyltransferase 1